MRTVVLVVLTAVLAGQVGGRSSLAQQERGTAPFVPIGVWYGGGTVRAPMVARDPAPRAGRVAHAICKRSIAGFNSIKTWVDWASAEPARGSFRFDALDQLLSLADEVRAAGHRPALRGRRARMAGQARIPTRASSPNRARASDRRRRPASASIMPACGRRSRRSSTPSPLAPRGTHLSTPSTSGASRTSSTGCGSTRPSNSATARTRRRASASGSRSRYRIDRGPQPRLVSNLQRLGPGRSAAVRHHPFLHRFHRLEDVRRAEAPRRSEAQGGRVRRRAPRRLVSQPLRCAGGHAEPAVGVRQPGRLVDERIRSITTARRSIRSMRRRRRRGRRCG